MRRIVKGQKPQILVDNEDAWTEDYLAFRQTGEPAVAATRHRSAGIKTAVRAECFDKCMYCETKLSAAQPGDVEHILPKNHYPNLYVSWPNLGLACTTCNTNKSDDVGFLNPYQTSPSDHIRHLGPMLAYQPGDNIGKMTVDGIKLNRDGLLLRRATALKGLMDKVELANAAQSHALRVVINQQVQELLEDDTEYCGTLRAYYQMVLA